MRAKVFLLETTLQVYAQDVLAVREATKWCTDYLRAGKVQLCMCGRHIGPLLSRLQGPLVMELYTYRFYGYSMSDPGKMCVQLFVCYVLHQVFLSSLLVFVFFKVIKQIRGLKVGVSSGTRLNY